MKALKLSLSVYIFLWRECRFGRKDEGERLRRKAVSPGWRDDITITEKKSENTEDKGWAYWKQTFPTLVLLTVTHYLTPVSPQMISYPLVIVSLLICGGGVFDQAMFSRWNLLTLSSCWPWFWGFEMFYLSQLLE